jgi:hypothetical protein
MSGPRLVRIVVAMDDTELRDTVAAAVAWPGATVGTVSPDALLTSELRGDVRVLLQTGDDAQRLIRIAEHMCRTWRAEHNGILRARAYPGSGAISDALVFRLWAIPGSPVEVSAYFPGEISSVVLDARRFLETL